MSTRSLPLDYDVVIYSGTSFKRTFRWLPDGTNPVDFTGWYAQMRIGQPLNVADMVLDTALGNILLSADGYLTVSMNPQQTAALVTSATWYNLDLTQPDGFVRRFLRGRVSVVVDVRQPV
jgi:hypothetical protein